MDSTDEKMFKYSLISLYMSAIPTFIALRFLQAPYGKHNRPGWGPTVSPPLAWFVMESPTLWLTLLIFPFGTHSSNPKSLILISPFLIHYIHRTIVYPIRLANRKPAPTTKNAAASEFPVSVALLAFSFNLMNVYLQVRFVSNYKDYESDVWFWWRFCGGLVVFVSGMAVNIKSDLVLVGLKNKGGGGYKVPHGGWFDLVCCPNYFGELLEWLGWALMTWSWTGFGFFLYTFANLVPRARANHIWYLEKFGEDYPRSRKIVIPYLY